MDREFSVTLASTRGPGDPSTNAEQVYELPSALGHSSFGVFGDPDEGFYGSTLNLSTSSAPAAITEGQDLWRRAHKELGIPAWPVTTAEARPYEDVVAELDRPNFPELVGIGEIAAMIGVSRQRAHSLARSGRFPSPAAELQAGPVFLQSSVDRFLETWTRKPGRPPRVDPEAVREEILDNLLDQLTEGVAEADPLAEEARRARRKTG